jgi:UDP-N-acetylmuramyl pentapeptide phosphotransferase/UDP-N-acetylglucosamine-1-phosphate transferase
MSAILGGAATSILVTFAMAWVWRTRGWGDGAGGPDGERKLQATAVPAVGGIAIASGWLVTALLGGISTADFSVGWAMSAADRVCFEGWLEGPLERWVIPAVLGLALVSGLLDDSLHKGLSPLAKLTVHAAVGVILALHNPTAECLALAVFLSMLSQNSLNTFDNADGASAGVTAAGLFACGSPLAPAVAVFLLPNLLRRGGRAEPWAYLGDAGSQLLGVAVLLTPGAWPVLVLPTLDLAYVSILRVRLSRGPWEGDRRHLAHRLQRAGLGPWGVAALLVGISSPVLIWPGFIGVAGTSLLFGVAAWGTRAHSEPKSEAILPTK